MFLEICIGLLTGLSACGALWALGSYIYAKTACEAIWNHLKNQNIINNHEEN